MTSTDRLLLALLGDWSTRAGLLSHERWMARWRDIDATLARLVRAGVVERTDTALGPMWRRARPEVSRAA